MARLTAERGSNLQIFLLDGAHCTLEIGQNILPILVPILMPVFGLSYTQVGLASTVFLITFSFSQPLVGRIRDPNWVRRIPIIGLVLSATFMALAGFAPSYVVFLMLITAAGLGSGIFHPHSSAEVWSFGGTRRATTMSTFNFAGLLGHSLSPLLAAAVLIRTGASGTFWLMIPALVFAGPMIASALKRPAPLSGSSQSPPNGLTTGKSYRAILLLSAVVAFRSWTAGSLALFLPLFLMNRSYSLDDSGKVLAVLLVFGALGGLIGGYLSDRTNPRLVTVVSLVLSSILLVGFVLVPGWLALAILFFAYAALISSLPVNQAMAQGLLPARAAFASGLVGFGMGVGGMAAVLTGALSDVFGLQTAFLALAALPLLAAGFAIFLPRLTSAQLHPGVLDGQVGTLG
jgi:MFS transporter, FSR family, fosmidomycin resistance protein